MIPPITKVAAQVDQVFLLIFGVSTVILIAITALMVWFVIRYHHTRHPKAADIRGNLLAEVIWTVIPSILVMGMFYYGWASFKALRSVPADAMRVQVTARMWSWVFEYENGKRASTLYVPLDRAVRLDMTSVDVIHSFFVPAFRIKMDTVPGMQTHAWFQAQRGGSYDILCAEYCGLRHANMLSTVEVMDPDDFRTWYESTAAGDEAAIGLLESYGCTACHSLDGSEEMGPTLLNIYGAQRRVIDANGTREAFVDEAYLRRAIIEPDAELVEGFEGMPSYKEEMPDQDLDAIIKYLTGGAKRDLDRGRQLMEAEGCLSCHSTDGSEIAGPTLKNIVGREVELADGSRTAADDEYLIEAIIDPEKFIVVGYDPIMPSYEHLTEDELQAMVDYMHALSENND
ncbi:cytochrome c oxidase subunit 2 [Desulfomicrobium norvegicum]|uniref:Cytochrome c oxidase subunit 2 n=1 Tax=Desulfomicrobium norvegicum (strain DSM 1741 / NCIMB 8310) TaxID=52561 RepID=A0A8G2C2K7_DESNO|nr:cytochrome c oxidase subunit II [Desulfomicrobium norvegicum]SFL66895.1 cytochrome c oxidase subunit 2 [Desulfomicrobium norvegicum]